MRFGYFGKQKSRYIGPFDVIARVGELAYELALPSSLDKIHNIFHVFVLKKYAWNESHIVPYYRELNVQPDVAYEEKAIPILARQDKVSEERQFFW